MTEKMSGIFRRILYFALILVIAVSAVKVYMLWWDRYEAINPQVIAATSYTHTDQIPARGILIWREEIVSSRWNGPVDYPSLEPRRVGMGETIAVISASSGRMAVKAGRVGYFIPALDGAEGNWTYSAFWNGMAPLPEPPDPVFFSPGGFVEKGKPVGKIILQPQELRCILYADVTPALERDIRSGTVRVKAKDGEWQGELVRVDSASQIRKNTFAVVLRNDLNARDVVVDGQSLGSRGEGTSSRLLAVDAGHDATGELATGAFRRPLGPGGARHVRPLPLRPDGAFR
ncbi:MAG: hypothetical protein EOM17_12915 [Synergistales bacterium]|nr:hypothetical protein [Synergistales bacterium]